jgi:mannose-1-phosphate guanylyltransferase
MVQAVRRAMGDGAAHGVRLRYAVESEPLGTAGGVRNALDLVGGLVLVLNGDVLSDVDLSAMLRFHRERAAAATIELFPVPDPTPYGLVELAEDGRVTRFIEKPDPRDVTTNTINAGVYVLDPALLARIPTGRAVSIEREFFPALLADRLPFFGWVSEHYWMDIGSPAKYRQAQLDLMAGKVSTGLAPTAGVAQIAADVTRDPTAIIAGPCVIGAGGRLEARCRIGPDSVLGERCVVGRAAEVVGAVLWEGVAVGEGAVLADCIVASGAQIGAGARIRAGAVIEAGRVIADKASVS